MRETAGAFGRPAIDWLSRSHLADARRERLLPASCSSKMAMIFLKSLGHLSEKPVIRQLAEAIDPSISSMRALP
jgi:hypothetical protein